MDEQNNILALSNAEIVMQLGKRFKEYRLSCRLTQQEAADKAGMSVVTLRQFENGKMYNITMGSFLGLLRAIDCLDQVQELLPEIPVSPYAMQQVIKNKPKRIRHAK
jgi:transcriptional regulator with XRE-family HTH domain